MVELNEVSGWFTERIARNLTCTTQALAPGRYLVNIFPFCEHLKIVLNRTNS